jgi:hypothetical protein
MSLSVWASSTRITNSDAINGAFPYDATRTSGKVGEFLGALVGTLAPVILIGLTLSWILAPVTGNPRLGTRVAFVIGALVIVPLYVAGQPTGRVRADNISDQQSSANDLNTPPGHVTHLNERDAGDARILAGECAKYLAEGNAQNVRYQRDLTLLLADGILRASKLGTLDGIAIARSKLQRLRQLVDSHAANRIALDSAMPGRYGALSIGTTMKVAAVRSCELRIVKDRKLIDHFADIWHQYADEGENLANFMEARIGTFQVYEGKVQFDKSADAAQFNVIVARLNELSRKQQKMIEESKDASDRSLRELARLDGTP